MDLIQNAKYSTFPAKILGQRVYVTGGEYKGMYGVVAIINTEENFLEDMSGIRLQGESHSNAKMIWWSQLRFLQEDDVFGNVCDRDALMGIYLQDAAPLYYRVSFCLEQMKHLTVKAIKLASHIEQASEKDNFVNLELGLPFGEQRREERLGYHVHCTQELVDYAKKHSDPGLTQGQRVYIRSGINKGRYGVVVKGASTATIENMVPVRLQGDTHQQWKLVPKGKIRYLKEKGIHNCYVEKESWCCIWAQEYAMKDLLLIFCLEQITLFRNKAEELSAHLDHKPPRT